MKKFLVFTGIAAVVGVVLAAVRVVRDTARSGDSTDRP